MYAFALIGQLLVVERCQMKSTVPSYSWHQATQSLNVL